MTLNVIPAPRACRVLPGRGCVLDAHTTIWSDPELQGARRLFTSVMTGPTGWDFPRAQRPSEAGIRFAHVPGIAELPGGHEAYRVRVEAGTVTVEAADDAGACWAVQTLRQLMPAALLRLAPLSDPVGPIFLPTVDIEDGPRFGHRGVMIDVARHFLPKPDLLRLIEVCAQYKLNVVHLHLSDDQGWRIQIDAFPRLTQIGSWRARSSVGDWRAGVYDSTPHGGFYTKDDLREVVAFASARHVSVVPEIDLPGHSQAAIAAYPWLAGLPDDAEIEVWDRWGINELVVMPSEASLEFFSTVLDEVMEVFPSPRIAIGGDEVPPTSWLASPGARTVAARAGLGGVEDLHQWFITRIAEHVAERGRHPVVWDEAAGYPLPEGTQVLVWRGRDAIDRAHDAGQTVVLCQEQDFYFDFPQSDSPDEPVPVGVVVPIERVAEFEPVTDRIDGLQANVWTEHLDSPQRVEFAAFPRTCALAEAAWDAREVRDPKDFMRRLVEGGLTRLEAAGIAYRPLEGPLPWQRRPGVAGRLRPTDHMPI